MLKSDKKYIVALIVFFSLLLAGSVSACAPENNTSDSSRQRIDLSQWASNSTSLQNHLNHSSGGNNQVVNLSAHDHQQKAMDANCQCCDQCDSENCLGCGGDCTSSSSFISHFIFIAISEKNYLQPVHLQFVYQPPSVQILRHPPKRLV